MASELPKAARLAWRRFLSSEAGLQGMLFLRETIPSINKGLPHEVQYDAGVSQGYIKALDRISEVISIAEKQDEKADND